MSTIPAIAMPGLGAPAPSAEPATRPVKVAKPADKRGWWWGTGRRKTAVARVRLRPASGEAAFTVIGKTEKHKTPEVYFPEERDRNDCYIAFKVANMEGKFEVFAKCHGGGTMAQSQAIRLGIARALCDYDPSVEASLRKAGFLTRDSREVERKKYGQAGARRRFQFSKR